ncbi:hypothetical protein [Rossellomorea sp. BNER]
MKNRERENGGKNRVQWCRENRNGGKKGPQSCREKPQKQKWRKEKSSIVP